MRYAYANQKTLLQLLYAKHRTTLHQLVHRVVEDLEFAHFSVIAVVDQGGADPRFYPIHNTPSGYMPSACDQVKNRRDPVMQHCKHQSNAIAWSRVTYVDADFDAQWEHQAQFGYRNGVSYAIHMPQGHHLVVGLVREQALPKESGALEEIIRQVQLLAVHAQEAMFSLVVPNANAGWVKLSRFELECLHWTMEGKTAWEIGRIISRSERAVAGYLAAATQKLHCTNKYQAIARAVRVGLVR